MCLFVCIYMSIYMGIFCMRRLFYFYALSIFHYFLKWTCTLFIKSTHSTKKNNWHSTFLKKGLGRFLDGWQDRRVKSITLSNLLLWTDEQMQLILRSHRFACKKEAPGDHSDLVPSMAGAWLLKSPFHLLLGWEKKKKRVPFLRRYPDQSRSPGSAGGREMLHCAQGMSSTGSGTQDDKRTGMWTKQVNFSFLGTTQTPDLSRLHYL